MGIVQLTHEQEFYQERILTTLAAHPKDWDSQAYDLASLFAQQGDAQARQLMRDTFSMNVIEDCAYGDAFMELDGPDGYLFVADQLGDQARVDDKWVYDYLHRRAEELFGGEEARLALERASGQNLRIKAYIEALEKCRVHDEERKEKPRPDVSKLNYEQVKEKLFGHGGLSLARWGEQATEADLKRAATDLLAETDIKRIRFLLSIFRKRWFPFDFRPLIEMANSSDHQISFRAFAALRQISHPSIREFAVDLLKSSPGRGRPVKLLINNYQEGDHALVESLATNLQDKDELHRLDADLGDFYEAHPNPVSEVRVLLTLYEVGPCTYCREGHVDRLLALGALPDWMRKECQHDANPDIRAMMKRCS